MEKHINCHDKVVIRPLNKIRDRVHVQRLAEKVKDYVIMETGLLAGDQWVDDFFAAAPPSNSHAKVQQLGLFCNSILIAAASVAYGFPSPHECYIGILVVDIDERNTGLGRHLTETIIKEAKREALDCIYISVIKGNDGGHKFWRRMKFVEFDLVSNVRYGEKYHDVIKLKLSI